MDPFQPRLTERQTQNPELPEEPGAAAAKRAPVHQTRRAGVARQFGEAGVITLRLQFGADGGEFLHRCRLALVALLPCFLGHKIISFRFSLPASLRWPGLRVRLWLRRRLWRRLSPRPRL